MDIDQFLTPQECADWLHISTDVLTRRSQGRKPAIPAVRITARSVRYHPRTILAKMAADAGVPFEVIAASFNEPRRQS